MSETLNSLLLPTLQDESEFVKVVNVENKIKFKVEL